MNYLVKYTNYFDKIALQVFMYVFVHVCIHSVYMSGSIYIYVYVDKHIYICIVSILV